MAKLVCQSGPNAGHEYPLKKDVTTMGRQSSCDVQIMDHMASRQHAQVRRDGKLYTLVDLGSRNGTNLNGKKVTERQLAYGDHIRVGECEWVLVKEPGDVELKDLLTRYEIQEKLGEGGMGVVYKAVQKSMARTVALKVLSPKYASRQRFVEQFIREARAAGQLNHAHIIQVHDVATENDIHYFSMEYVDGPTCMQLLRANGAFAVPEALEVTRQVAKALEYAHEHRLIHQDIKPDNIMIGSNSAVKLADLGISKTFDEAENEEGPKRVMGTPHYMAPEAALGKKIDHRVDLYSLGATLYHLLTGKTPYTGTSATEVLKAQVMDPLPAIQDINAKVPDDVCALVERLMAKKPEDRYQSASEVADELKRLQAGMRLGTDRIPSGDTMILQRLAKGVPAGGGGPVTPGEPRTASGHGTNVPTGEHAASDVETRRLRLLFGLGLAAVVVFVLIIVATRFAPRGDAGKPDGGSTAPTPPTAGDTPGGEAPVAVDDPDLARRERQAAQLGELEANLREPSPDLGQLMRTVEAVLADNPAATERTRAEGLRTRIVARIADLRRAQLEQAFDRLRGEVDELNRERNYDLALARLKAFSGANDKDIGPKVNALRDATTRERDAFVADLRAKIRLATDQKSAARLSALRDQLPPPFLGGAIEQEIVSALGALETETQQRHQVVLRDAANDLARWDIAKVEERHRSLRAEMGESPAGRQFDAFLAAARLMPDLATTVDQRLRQTGMQRFGGELLRLQNPDLVGATRAGLRVQPAGSSGEAELPWKNIEPPVLQQVLAQVLKDEAAKWQPLVEALSTARTMVK